MATGGNVFSRTLEGGHETFYDFSCSVCDEENKHVEAIKYCEECFVYLCDHCLRNHNKLPLNRRHQLLNQSQFATVNKPALVSFPTKRCSKHPGELINIFCANHDVVCCSVCKALEHSSCLKTQHLPNAAKGIQTSQEFHNILTGTKTFVSDVDKALNNRKADLSRIAKEKQSVRKTITDFRKKINKYFDDLEANSLAELNHIEQMIVSRIDKDKNYLETTKSNAEVILKTLESFKGENDCDLFVQVKIGSHFVNDAVKRVRFITEAEEKTSIQFEINRNIEEYFSSLKSFGSFVSTGIIATPPQLSPLPQVKTRRLKAQHKSEHSVQYSTYKTKNVEKFDIKKKSDVKMCNICSICQLPDNTFLITDWNNVKLKRLDQSLKLLDSVKLSHEPDSVCAVGLCQAAVSVVIEKKIQFVSVGKKLKLKNSFTVGNDCRGIAYVGNELFVCCGNFRDPFSGCIEVYNNEGQLQRTIPCDDQQRTYSVPLYITVSDDGQHLLVTSFKSDVITLLDLTGNVVNIFSHKDLNKPRGICTDGRGQVFVCGVNSHTIVQLSPETQKIDVLLKEIDGIIKPFGIYYDRGKSRLIVSCSRTNELLSFTLKL